MKPKETDRYKYSLLGIRSSILIGLGGLMSFVGMEETHIYLFLLLLNIFLFLVSYLVHYDDGKKIFELGMHAMGIILLGTIGIQENLLTMWQSFSLLLAGRVGIYAFLKYLIGIFYPISPRYTYQL